MYVRVYCKETSKPITHERVVNTYTKGDLYCVKVDNGVIVKYPLGSLFKVEEVE